MSAPDPKIVEAMRRALKIEYARDPVYSLMLTSLAGDVATECQRLIGEAVKAERERIEAPIRARLAELQQTNASTPVAQAMRNREMQVLASFLAVRSGESLNG